MRLRPAIPALVAALTLAGSVAFAADAPKAAGDAKHGKELYAANCAACHGATYEGGVGPALKDEKKRKDAAAIKKQIENPAPPMPKLYPSTLSAKDVDDLTAFVLSL